MAATSGPPCRARRARSAPSARVEEARPTVSARARQPRSRREPCRLGGLRPLPKAWIPDEPDRAIGGEAGDAIGPVAGSGRFASCNGLPLTCGYARRPGRDGGRHTRRRACRGRRVRSRQVERDRPGTIVGDDPGGEVAAPRVAALRTADPAEIVLGPADRQGGRSLNTRSMHSGSHSPSPACRSSSGRWPQLEGVGLAVRRDLRHLEGKIGSELVPGLPRDLAIGRADRRPSARGTAPARLRRRRGIERCSSGSILPRRDPQRPSAVSRPCRSQRDVDGPVSGRDAQTAGLRQGLSSAAVRSPVDARDGAGQLIRRPDLPSDDPRYRSGLRRPSDHPDDAVGSRVDLRHGPVDAVRHPDGAEPDGDGGRALADVNRLQQLSVARVQLDHGVADLLATQTAPSPTATAPGSAPASRSSALPVACADLRDGVVGRVRHPDVAAFVYIDAGRAVPDGDPLELDLRAGIDLRDGPARLFVPRRSHRQRRSHRARSRPRSSRAWCSSPGRSRRRRWSRRSPPRRGRNRPPPPSACARSSTASLTSPEPASSTPTPGSLAEVPSSLRRRARRAESQRRRRARPRAPPWRSCAAGGTWALPLEPAPRCAVVRARGVGQARSRLPPLSAREKAPREARGKSTRFPARGRRRALSRGAVGTARRRGAPPHGCRRPRAPPSGAGSPSRGTARGRSSPPPSSPPQPHRPSESTPRRDSSARAGGCP